MSNFLDHLSQRVLLCDGAMGTQVQARNLDLQRDFLGQENCTEILNKSRPDLVREIHATYLAAGSDMVQTNSFGGSPITLGEFGLRDEAFAINKTAAELAWEAVEQFQGDGRTRFVLGSVGPGTRLPTLGHVPYQALEDALAVQCAGLVAGGVSAILIETCQDPLQIKAAINGAKRARADAKKDIPILVQVTVETTGTLLVGADIAAAATVVDALGVDSMGLNCATGPQEMQDHVRWLSRNWRRHISVQPNAGLPELIDGHTHYPLGPDEIARWQERFVVEEGVSMVGGCCGTVGPHIAALDQMLKRVGAKTPGRDGAKYRPTPVQRAVHYVPAIASLYGQVELRQENAYLSIGERCNANGSKKFRELQDSQDWDGCVAMGKDQEKEGSHALDVCCAYVGHDEVKEMGEVIGRMRGAVRAPLVVDSTEYPVLESSLALYGGKAIINSINFEDGEVPARKRLLLARKFGTAVIALTIEEAGMAKTAEKKLEVAMRLYDFAVNQHGLPPHDLLFDPLTFTICTGNADDRKLGLETLEGIERIAQEMPQCQIILGLSNISFGLNPAARHVLNSVYLDEALKRGLTGAIVHVARILPLHKIPEAEKDAALNLIYDRWVNGKDPLQAFIALFGDRKVESTKKARSEHVEERLKQRIVDGDRQGLDADLAEAMQKGHKPLDIINTFLLDGMKVVGDLFGAGKMQLPFVLQSAETMKAAVAYLQPHMEKSEGPARGTIVLATVRGDVHDIGKNLVDIILTNNGYKVVNLGIKQPIQTIMEAAKSHAADAVGMSGLLVKSTVIMRENLEEMTRQGFETPVLLGGAALTRAYVEEDCTTAYGPGRVAYAQDAFDGLGLMNHVMEGKFDDFLQEQRIKRAAKPKSTKKLGQPAQADLRPVELEETRLRREELNKDVPSPVAPFFGPRVIEQVNLKALMPYLNETMLFQFHWGYRKQGRKKEEFDAWAQKELKPIIARIAEQCMREEILKPQAIYGYWHAAAEGNDLILFGEHKAEVARFTLPRQKVQGGLCIADFVKDVKSQGGSSERDVVGLQLVTVGQHASEVAREWFAKDRYQDYLYLHGFGVEITEALAEYVHKRIRHELGHGAEDAPDMHDLLKQGYRGSRYSFGYPACPNLGDQRKLLEILGAERIGVSLGEGDQLHPEQSTSALVILHPQAKYFSV
ncbi:MAG: methionine synthase [Alphaproteobacteria bacterium]|nr:methionine synthase [Alphaproteobacteria bacterium]